MPTLCCIPVSWPTGLGELARMATLATAARRHWPDLRCHFVLNRQLPEAIRALLPAGAGVTWLATSPTNDDAGVVAALATCRPAVTLFDNAGTGAQCRAAREHGGRTVFLSTRARALARGFAPEWLPWLDEHWRVGPGALTEPLAAAHRARAAAHGVRVRSLQALFAPPDPRRAAALRAALGLIENPYVVFLPGGGGGSVGGRSAVSTFAEAAARLAAQAGIACVLLVGPLFQGAVPERRGVAALRLPHEQVGDLVADARLVVVGASSSLFQALAQRRVCVATTAGGSEQLERARAWAARGVVAAAEPEAQALARAAAALLADETRWRSIARAVADLRVDNDLPRAIAALGGLLGRGG